MRSPSRVVSVSLPIALRASDIDVVYCHGYGFPKHLGGPMYWAQQEGFEQIDIEPTRIYRAEDASEIQALRNSLALARSRMPPLGAKGKVRWATRLATQRLLKAIGLRNA